MAIVEERFAPAVGVAPRTGGVLLPMIVAAGTGALERVAILLELPHAPSSNAAPTAAAKWAGHLTGMFI